MVICNCCLSAHQLDISQGTGAKNRNNKKTKIMGKRLKTVINSVKEIKNSLKGSMNQ